MNADDPHTLTGWHQSCGLAEHAVVETSEDGQDLALLPGIAGISILLWSVVIEDWEWIVHPLVGKIFTIEDFDGARPDGFRARMFHLHCLGGNRSGNDGLSRAHILSLLFQRECGVVWVPGPRECCAMPLKLQAHLIAGTNHDSTLGQSIHAAIGERK